MTRSRSTRSGNRTAPCRACIARVHRPVASATRRTPRSSQSKGCWQMTWSNGDTQGRRAPRLVPGTRPGDEEILFPKRFGATMNPCSGSSARLRSMIRLLARSSPPRWSPQVRYAGCSSGSLSPFCSRTWPRRSACNSRRVSKSSPSAVAIEVLPRSDPGRHVPDESPTHRSTGCKPRHDEGPALR